MDVLLIPMGSAGDMHPLIGLGVAMRDRGHHVTMVANPYFEQMVSRAGLEQVALGTREMFEDTLSAPELWQPRKAFVYVAQHGIIPGLRIVYDLIAERYVPGKTVVLAGTMSMGARVAQEKLGVPTISIHLQPGVIRSLIRPSVFKGMFMPPWSPTWYKRLMFWLSDTLVVDRIVCPELNTFRKELGLPPVRHILADWVHSPLLTLGLFPDWYGMPQADWPKQLVMTGFPLFDERTSHPLSPDLQEFLDEGPPLAFTPGSAMTQGDDFFKASVEACKLLNRRGLLLTRHVEQIPPDLPPTVRHFAYAPFSQLLPHCAALIYHGGIGTAAQGLAAGIPHLVMPLAHDQHDNADRLRQLGVGRSLERHAYQGEAVARELRVLLDSPEVAIHCQDYADRIRRDKPLENACKAIEAVAERKKVSV
jgi:rhamnosyltransferase subunit B